MEQGLCKEHLKMAQDVARTAERVEGVLAAVQDHKQFTCTGFERIDTSLATLIEANGKRAFSLGQVSGRTAILQALIIAAVLALAGIVWNGFIPKGGGYGQAEKVVEMDNDRGGPGDDRGGGSAGGDKREGLSGSRRAVDNRGGGRDGLGGRGGKAGAYESPGSQEAGAVSAGERRGL